MKYSSKKNSKQSTKKSRQSLIGMAVVATVLLIGVVTALSMQSGQSRKTQTEAKKATQNKNYVTLNAAGQTVVVDKQSGKMRPLTPEEAMRLAEGINQMVNQSTDGLVQVNRADGSVSMDLQGRFQNVILMKKEDDGTLSEACVDNVESAAAFFDIDPALVGAAVRSQRHSLSHKLEDR